MTNRHRRIRSLRLDDLSSEELHALAGLTQYEGWKALCKAIDSEAARVRGDLDESERDGEPSKFLRPLGEMAILEKVQSAPMASAVRLRAKEKKQHEGTQERQSLAGRKSR